MLYVFFCLFWLQVVYHLVEAANDIYALPGDRADASRWKTVFLETGGMRHLLNLILEGGGIDPSQVHAVSLAGSPPSCIS